MPTIPVICDRCERLWFNTNIFGPGMVVQLNDAKIGFCPYCLSEGVMADGTAPNGLYSMSEGVTRFIADTLDSDDLTKLLKELLDAQRKGASAEEIADRLAKRVPKASPLAPLFSQTGLGVAQWLMLLIAIITAVQVFNAGGDGSLTRKQIAEIAEAARAGAAESTRAKQPTATRPQPRRCRPIDPCWCGSGSKFKHCHGRLRR